MIDAKDCRYSAASLLLAGLAIVAADAAQKKTMQARVTPKSKSATLWLYTG